jgi:hypothetical protein
MLSLLSSCAAPEIAEPIPAPAPVPVAVDPFAQWLDDTLPVADGFSPPPGSIADGVVETSGEILRIRHRWYENHEPREVVARWEGLTGVPGAGARVRRGERLGTGDGILGLEGTEEAPEAFVAARRVLFVPQREPVLALVSHEALEMRTYASSEETGRFAVSLGQASGAKERRGDNRTPKGMYFVTQRSRGPFGGDYAAWYGGIWLRLNYPNAWDAARGVDDGLITPAQQRSITRAWRARGWTANGTALGGGIGIHAWASEWPDDGPRALSWGCLVVHPSDADRVYAALPDGAMVVLF